MISGSFNSDTEDHPCRSVRIMFYNVENLFNVVDDSLKDDQAFLPDGVMRWNSGRYKKKIDQLYKTIVAAGEWNPPAIVAFCEVEGRSVLEDLIYKTYLSKYNYGILHEDSPDPRGIDVCIIYRRDCVEMVDFSYWVPETDEGTGFTSRSVLCARFVVFTDTLHLIVNHWPSRRGGVLAGEELRLSLASMIREKADSITGQGQGDSKIVVLGDFNCSPGDRVMQALVNPEKAGSSLVNLSESIDDGDHGTYRYKGTWELIDQVIVSENLLTCKKGLFTDASKMTVFKPDFLLEQDQKYPGVKPFSTYSGYLYKGGFSDHLPVLLDINFR